MTPEEARAYIGYTTVTSVLLDVKSGKLKVTPDGMVTDKSVFQRKARRDAQLARTKTP